MSNKEVSSNYECSPSPQRNSSIHTSSLDIQLTPTFTTSTTSNNRQHPSHLILNNFVVSSTDNSMPTQDQRDNSSGNGVHNTHANFLYVYFTFSYYLCLSPFRLKKVISPSENGRPSFEMHEFLPQKIICGVANVLAMIRYCVELRRCIHDVQRDNPISFFKLFEGCSGIIFKAVILRCFWTKQKRYLQVVRFLDGPYVLPYNKFKLESIYTIASLCGFYVTIGFVRMITGSGFVRSPSHLTPSWWARRLVAEARYSFFLSNDTRIDFAPTFNEITTLDAFLTVITGLTFQCRFIAGYFVDVGILLSVLTLWAPVAGFCTNINRLLKQKLYETFDVEFHGESIKHSSSPHPTTRFNHIGMNDATEGCSQELVMKQYKTLKVLTELITQANGATILPFISEAVFGYAIFFEDVLITQDFLHRLILLCFYFCAVSILAFSADICRKIQCMKAWLWDNERFSTFPNQKLMLVLHDLSTNSVGITASGIFTVDFYLVGSMISVLITLFIIRLQYQSQEPGG